LMVTLPLGAGVALGAAVLGLHAASSATTSRISDLACMGNPVRIGANRGAFILCQWRIFNSQIQRTLVPIIVDNRNFGKCVWRAGSI
jgi:predicted alpha/beta-fold hydrolase